MIQHCLLRDVAEAPEGSSKQLACTFDISMSRQSLRSKGRIWSLADSQLVQPFTIQADADGDDLIAGVVQLQLHLLEMPL